MAESENADIPAPILQVEGLSFRYRDAEDDALRGITWHQDAGQFTALVGPSGAGKTTFCRCLNRIIPHFHKGNLRGRVRVGGESIAGKHVYDMAPRIGMVFQDFESQLFSTNVRLEVAFGLENLGLPREEMEGRVRDALALVGLAGFQEREPAALSGGQKQRLSIAAVIALAPDLLIMDEPTTDLDPAGRLEVMRLAGSSMTKGERQRVAVASVLAAAPEVIVLDEPTTGLDYRQQLEMMALVRRLHAAGRTIILITHSMWIAAEYARRCVVMADGRVIANGPTRQVFADEEVLARAHLRAPAITQFGNRLGFAALSVEELLARVERGRA
ncbi:MAG: energy-coupling factor ABC transporter ATP-binding protein [Armatimonadota bacterium]